MYKIFKYCTLHCFDAIGWANKGIPPIKTLQLSARNLLGELAQYGVTVEKDSYTKTASSGNSICHGTHRFHKHCIRVTHPDERNQKF